MVLRFLMRYLANNEQLVNKLAESKPIRRAAQLVVYFINRAASKNIPTSSDELAKQWKSIYTRFSANIKEGIEDAKQEMRKKQQK